MTWESPSTDGECVVALISFQRLVLDITLPLFVRAFKCGLEVEWT